MPKTRVFVVEDEAIISNDIQQSLLMMGYEISGTATTGESAVDKILSLRPDVVLMDIMLGGRMDGIEASEAISAKLSVPVIYVTAYADDRVIERAKLTEPFGYIIKPFEDRELHFAIQMAIYKHSMQERLKRKNEFVTTIIESLTHPFYIIDSENHSIVMANKAAAFGELGPDTKCHQLVYNSGSPCTGDTGHPCLVDEVSRTGHSISMEHTDPGTEKAGARTYQVHAYPVFDPVTGKVAQVIKYMLDITEQKALERQLYQSQRLESIGRLAGGVAHDFSNIMSAVLGYSEMAIMELPEDHPVREKLEIIRDAGEKAATLTKQLLAFSSRQIMELRPLDINRVIEEMVKMLVRLIGDDIMLDIHPGKDTNGLSVIADRGQIEQIVLNLSVNARDAMPAGGTLSIQTSSLTLDADSAERPHVALKDGRYIVLRVADTGEGMSAEIRERIFEPFFTTKKEGRGTGLGLSTVYGIVKQHHGAIEVESTPGRGTAFLIYIPATVALDTAAPRPKLGALGKGSGTILVVDDEPSIRGLLRDILKPLGYNVIDAPDGEAALRLAASHEGPIDLLITDIVMPNINGIQLESKLRRIRPGIKVLYMSGYWKHIDDPAGELNEANLLPKPIRPTMLAAKVHEVLGPVTGDRK